MGKQRRLATLVYRGTCYLLPHTDLMPKLTPLPLSSHAKPVDSFAPAAELENELKRRARRGSL